MPGVGSLSLVELAGEGLDGSGPELKPILTLSIKGDNMGNKAVITTEEEKIGVYLNWNGGRDSVEAFLAVCDKLGHRKPENDCYGWARLCQVIANYFGGVHCIGIDRLECLDCDNKDNGMYIIKDWKIVGRKYFDDRTEQNEYDLDKMIVEIMDAQPQNDN